MGCWDVFCFLCGNTCYRARFDEDNYYYENAKNKYKNQKLFNDKIKNIIKNTKWLEKCTFLATNNEIIHNCEEVSCNGVFEDENNTYIHNADYESLDNMMNGVFVHTDCWKFIKKEYKINLSYSHLPILEKNPVIKKIFNFINYGTIEKYWEQYFNFLKIILDSNEELCYSPLKSKLVARNVKKNFLKLKIRTDSERKGPAVSASFYSNDLYKIGVNNNIWMIKNNKWVELKNTIKYNFTTNKKIFKKIIFSADVNINPVFILQIKEKKKMIEYDIITTDDYLKKIKI